MDKLKLLLNKRVLLALVALVVIVAAALGATGVVNVACIAEGLIGTDTPTLECAQSAE